MTDLPTDARLDPGYLLTLQEVETELRVTRVTLHRWIKSGKLKAVKIGAYWRVHRSVIDEMKGGTS